MSEQHNPPAAMSDAEVALVRKAFEYRGSETFAPRGSSEGASERESEGVSVWDRARTQLRRTIVGTPVSKSSAKKIKKIPRGKKVVKSSPRFVRGLSLATAVFVLMLMPLLGVVASAIAIAITGRALLVGRIRGPLLIATGLVHILAWLLLFRVA